MLQKDGRDYLYLIWKSEITRKQYIVGQLTKNGQYEFQYSDEILDALKDGFELLVSFPDINTIYKNDILFPTFSSRLPDRKRKDINRILAKYNLEEFDPYMLLKRSGAKLPIDNLEFIDPILDLESPFSRIFFMAGTRHYIGCNGEKENCEQTISLHKDEVLLLQREPENEKDSNAVAIYTDKKQKIGYIPRYYSKAISEMLLNNKNIICKIYDIAKNSSCQECVKLILKWQM